MTGLSGMESDSRMGSDEKGFESMLQRLRDVRQSLLRLHKTLLQWEREEYERAHGRIETSYEFLRLVMHDPWFGWLHHLSELIVQIDEMLAAEEPPVENAATAVMDQARVLLVPSENEGQFQRKYFDSLQHSPEVVLAHAETIKILGPARPANLPADQRSEE